MYNSVLMGKVPYNIERVYLPDRINKIKTLSDLYPELINNSNFEEHISSLQNIKYIFSTWGMPNLTMEQIGSLPNLEVVFYAAGSVKGFAEKFLRSGVKVVSSWGANAIPVAEFTVSQILLASKGFFQASQKLKKDKNGVWKKPPYPGNYGTNVSLLGAGMIGRKVIELLKPYNINILLFDPFMKEETAKELGVKLVSLKEAFSNGFIVSNHLANVPATEKMITGRLLKSIPQNGTFINTGRGITVNESEMIEVLKERVDLTALLDVTHPEPPEENSPLYSMDNVFLSPHIAGSLGNEVFRIAECAIEEFERYLKGEELQYSVTLDMLKTMA